MRGSHRVVLGRLTQGVALHTLEKYCIELNFMVSTPKSSERRSLQAAFGIFCLSGVIVFTAGDAVAIPVGSLQKPVPVPLTESSHVNARLGIGPSPKLCLGRPTKKQQTL